LLEICYFYISQTKSSLDKIFYKVVYHHIICMCDFLVNLDDCFIVVCTSFHSRLVSIQVRFYMNQKPAKPWRISPAKFCKNVRHQLPHLRKLHTGRPFHQILKTLYIVSMWHLWKYFYTFFLCGGSLNPYITANGSLWSWMWVQCCYGPKTLVMNQHRWHFERTHGA